MAVEALESSAKMGFYSPIFLGLVTTIASLVAVYWWQQNKRFVKMGNAIPGPTSLPFIGNAHLVVGKTHNEILEMALKLSKNFGNSSKAWLGSKLLVFLTDPRDVEIILSSNTHLDKSEEYRFFKPWLGNGLLISSGDFWRRHRKMIAPTFHQNVLKSFIGTFYENSTNVVNRLKKELNTGKDFDVHDYMSEATVDILLETAMGTKRTAQNNQGYEYAMAVMKMCDIIHKRTYNILYRWDTFYNKTSLRNYEEKLLGIIHGLTKRVIKHKNENYDKLYKDGSVPTPSLHDIIKHDYMDESSNKSENKKTEAKGLRDDLDDIDENDVGEKRRLAFLDLMIETAKGGANLTDDEIKDEVNTIMFEGHDTTAAASSFTLCLLGIHKDIQDKVYKELYSIFGDSDRPCTFNDTLEMKYLERVIMESLRMYPPVPVIARHVNEDIKLASENYVIPKGATVVVVQFKIHRRPDIYPNPDVFNPDNFLPENSANRHYYSFIPFSAGPRSCVGRKYAMLKLKVLLSTILRNYKIHSNVPESEYKLQADIILKRTDGFRIQLEPRQRIAV
ncbi:cytochrome P450 4g1-like [Condylostylus longicornis]|uniref:cytochrome P450 4g1-like n=1 Tax=Condylostylus longicornis TaxID=2530218 RepID=UPI00244E1ADA|nr:cytochrome P450 4g1-like [Condylostylus longicornis]